MSRSNVPANHPGNWPPAARGPGEIDPRDTTGRPAQRPAYGQPAPQGFGQPQQPQQPGAYPQQAQPQQPGFQPAPGYAAYPDPQAPYADPMTQGRAPQFAQPRTPSFADAPRFGDGPPTGGRPAQPAAPQPGPHLGGAPNYVPQFDPYVPATQPSQPSPFAQLAGQSAPQHASPYAQQQPSPYAQQPQAAPSPYAPQGFGRPAGFDPQSSAAQPNAPQFGQRTTPMQQLQAPQDQALSQLASPRAQQLRVSEPSFAPQAPQQQPALQSWNQPGAPATPTGAPQTSPHGFDLGGFLPNEPTTGGRRPTASAQPSPSHGTPSDLNFGDWPRQAPGFGGQQPFANAPEQHAGFEAEPSLDAHGQPYGNEYDGHQAGDLEQAHEHEADEEGYDYDEPKKRSSLMLVGGALVAAVIVGSGLAFVYQKFMPAGGAQTAAIVKSDGAPSKVKPAEPGGKQFAHTDSKVMGRLSDNGTPITTASTAASDADAGGPRKVSTIAVGRDGSLSAPPPSPSPEPTAAAPQPSVSVPGMTIVDGFGGRARPASVAAVPAPPAAAAPPQQPVVVTPPAATVKPVVTAKAAPVAPAAVDPDLAMAAAAEAPAAKKAVAPKKKVVDAYGAAAGTVPAAAPAPSAPVTTASTGGSGFIPVLASVPASAKSRMEALKQFADMQQKYGTVLSDKTPDVQEANLGEKGTYHRLLAGPPGSREQATQVCGQLKAAGYSGCWVTAY